MTKEPSNPADHLDRHLQYSEGGTYVTLPTPIALAALRAYFGGQPYPQRDPDEKPKPIPVLKGGEGEEDENLMYTRQWSPNVQPVGRLARESKDADYATSVDPAEG